MNKLKQLILIAAAAFGFSDTMAATIEMNGGDSAGESSWNSGKHWTGGAAPCAGNDYVVLSGKTMRTPNEASPCDAFAGDSLTINGTLALKHTGGYDWNDWAKAEKWTLGAGGTVNVANGGRVYILGPDNSEMTVLGTADNPSCFRVSNNNGTKSLTREIRVRNNLKSGSGAVILVRRSDDDADPNSMTESDPSARVKFIGDNSGYNGAFEISRIPGNSSKSTGTGWHYIIDFGQDTVPGGSSGVKATMGAGVDSGAWLTMGHQTVLCARGMPFTSRYALKLGNESRGDDGGDVRIVLYNSNDACLSGRHGKESVWFGDGTKITGSGASVLSIVNSDGYSCAAAFGDVTISEVARITVASPAILRFYPGYDNPSVPFESNTTVSDGADGIGPMTLKAGGFISPGYDTQGIGTMGFASLTMEADSFLYYSAVPTEDGGTTNDFIRITGNLVNSTGGKIKIGFDALCTSMKPGDKLALLSAANLGDVGVTADDFELDNTVRITDDALDNNQLAGSFSIETIGGAKTLVFTQTSKQVVALVGKDIKGESCFEAASSSGAHWSNNAKPDAEHDYLVPEGTLLRVNSGSHTFAGHSLSILRGGCFGLDLTSATVGDLHLYGGAVVDARDQAQNGGQSLTAGITVYATKDNPVTIENTGLAGNYTRTMTFSDGSTLKGTGDIRFRCAAGHVAEEPNSTTYVNWDGTDFSGGIVITGRAARVSCKDEKAMGGPAPTFRADRLRLEGNGQLVCNGAYTMSDPTRGIYIGGGVSGETMADGGTIAVWSGPLVISNFISGASMLRKIGDGTLKLCCPSNTFSGTLAHKQGKLYICHKDTLAKASQIQCYDNATWFIDTPEGMTVSSKSAFCRDGGSQTAKFKINLPALDACSGVSTIEAPIFRVKGATLADAEEIEDWIELVNVPKSWKREFRAVESNGELVVSIHAKALGLTIIIR